MNIEEMICVVEIYIHIRKNKEVNIKHPRNARDLFLLSKAYNYALKWMEANNVKINQTN